MTPRPRNLKKKWKLLYLNAPDGAGVRGVRIITLRNDRERGKCLMIYVVIVSWALTKADCKKHTRSYLFWCSERETLKGTCSGCKFRCDRVRLATKSENRGGYYRALCVRNTKTYIFHPRISALQKKRRRGVSLDTPHPLSPKTYALETEKGTRHGSSTQWTQM